MPSVLHELSNGAISTAVLFLTLPGLLWLVTPGTNSDDSTVSYGIERHPISGICVLSLSSQIQRGCGDPSIGFLAVWPAVLPFWPMNTATTSPTNLMRFAGLLQIHPLRTLRQLHHHRHCPHFGTRPLKRLVYLFAGFWTNLRLPIQFRLRF